MREFEVPTRPYEERLYLKKNVVFNTGLTVLVGCNGSGKSTLLTLLKEQLSNDKDALVLSYDDRSNGGRNLMEKFGFQDRMSDLARMMTSSEGEKIHHGIEDFVIGMRREIWRREPRELWIFMDAVGSGMSIDGIQEIKDLADAIIEDNERQRDVYFVVSTNEYEFAENADCIDVTTFNHMTFTSYDVYRDYILKTRKKKDKRTDRNRTR